MEDNVDKTEKQLTDESIKVEKKKMHSIFSNRDINNIVKGFVHAWLSGKLKIHFPTAPELLAKAKWEKKSLDPASATERELEGKKDFLNHILICSGAIQATEEELQSARIELFKDILSYRAGDRLEGVFMESDLEERINKIERSLAIVNRLVQEWIRTHTAFEDNKS